MARVTRVLIYEGSEERLIRSLLNRSVKGRVEFDPELTIEEKFFLDSGNILKAIMDDMTGGKRGKVHRVHSSLRSQ